MGQEPQPPRGRGLYPAPSSLLCFLLCLPLDRPEKATAPHSSTLAWKIPWTEEPGRLQSMGSLSQTQLSDFTFTFHFHALEKAMATHSSVLAWRIPETEEPGGLPSMGSHRVGHDWSDLAAVIRSQRKRSFGESFSCSTEAVGKWMHRGKGERYHSSIYGLVAFTLAAL